VAIGPGWKSQAIKEHDAKKKRADEEHHGQVLDKLLSRLDEMVDHVGGLTKRMDATEADAKKRDDAKHKRKTDADDDDTKKDAFAEQPNPEMNLAKQTVADARADDAARKLETDMAAAQEKCDSVASQFGMRAAPPLIGEKLLDYRRRLLRPFQRQKA
jgi:hypothetical protein